MLFVSLTEDNLYLDQFFFATVLSKLQYVYCINEENKKKLHNLSVQSKSSIEPTSKHYID